VKNGKKKKKKKKKNAAATSPKNPDHKKTVGPTVGREAGTAGARPPRLEQVRRVVLG